MLLALMLALANAPEVEPLEIAVSVQSRPQPDRTVVGVRSKEGKEELFEVELEDGQGTVTAFPVDPPPYHVRIIDDRLVDLKQPFVHSSPTTVGTLGRAAAQFMVKHSSGGRIEAGHLFWVHGEQRVEIASGMIPIVVRELGLLHVEEAYLEVSAVGGHPIRVELLDSVGVPTMNTYLLPERTVQLRVVDETGVPLSGVQCVMTPLTYTAPWSIKPTDGDGRVSFEGIAGLSNLAVLFSDHFTDSQTVDIESEDNEELLVVRPTLGALQLDASELSPALADVLYVHISPSGMNSSSREGSKLSELAAPILLPAGPTGISFSYMDETDLPVIYANQPITHLITTIPVVGNETTKFPADASELPSRFELVVLVDGKSVTEYSVRFRSGLVDVTHADMEGTVLLGHGTFDITVTSNDGSWKREFEVEASGGEILEHRIEIDTKD